VALSIIQLFRLKEQIRPGIIKSVSMLLLAGASLYILEIPVNFLIDYYSGGEYEQYTFKDGNLLSVLILFGAWLFSFGLVPQILWAKKLRGRLSSLIVIIAIWAVTRIFVPWGLLQFIMQKPFDWQFKLDFSFLDRLEQIAVYTVAFALVYYIVSRRDNDTRPIVSEAD